MYAAVGGPLTPVSASPLEFRFFHQGSYSHEKHATSLIIRTAVVFTQWIYTTTPSLIQVHQCLGRCRFVTVGRGAPPTWQPLAIDVHDTELLSRWSARCTTFVNIYNSRTNSMYKNFKCGHAMDSTCFVEKSFVPMVHSILVNRCLEVGNCFLCVFLSFHWIYIYIYIVRLPSWLAFAINVFLWVGRLMATYKPFGLQSSVGYIEFCRSPVLFSIVPE